MDYLKKSKHLWIIPAYGIFYMISFMLVERIPVETHLIHTFLDDKIPFCEYFIIPYVLWYFVVLGSVLYFALGSPGKKEYYQYMGTLAVGMTLFLIISYVYPNGQDLRPVLEGGSPFIQAVQFLYLIDTPTNIFPSMHVFNAVACCVALLNNKKCRQNRIFTAGNIIITVSIVLSTMFLKQHSVEDVVTALILNVICYQVFYRIIPENLEKFEKMFTVREIFTIPNFLSAGRLILALAFMAMLQRHNMRGEKSLLALLLLVVIATDILDGRIARSTGRVTEIGKLLDPVADKVMQFVLLACLVPRYSLAKLILMLFFIKESYTLVLGWKYMLDADKNQMVRWHGRLNTMISYVVGLILFASSRLPSSTANILVGAVGVCMLMSFVMYMDEFRLIQEQTKGAVRKKIPGRVG
ncbi:MAG: CDP-alcohol phosphatidyltransferase family protein [Blautia sp.]|uniref:CDP-alcohol phosphatidyltransferase family protein n=1 Tax=Blautia sp. TaxID=1955243 RepID=UPI002A7640D9|nr:CDP-alcohol phosphatidyltransferase family protein [Blautia sp.]MDY3017367.1 CDP-alcohol phosphatidyltransferase family protein [Blautia sp.]